MKYVAVFLILIVGSIAAGRFSTDRVAAQSPAAPESAQRQPGVDEVLDNYVKALGGKEAIARINSRVMKGKFEGAKLPFPDICEAWGVARLGDGFRRPPKSKVPVLIISGTIDGRTPVSNGVALGKRLSRSVQLVIEGASHDGLFASSPRISEVVAEFVKTGRISTSRISLGPISFFPVENVTGSSVQPSRTKP